MFLKSRITLFKVDKNKIKVYHLKKGVFNMYKKSYNAFTLAELLVVLAIIGVVSALTLPNLSQNTGRKETVAQVLKARSTIGEAYDRAISTYGQPALWITNDATTGSGENTDYSSKEGRLVNRIIEYLHIDKDCGKTSTACWDSIATTGKDTADEDKVSNTTGTTATSTVGQNSGKTFYHYLLADGSALAIRPNPQITPYGKQIVFTAYIDVDGPNKGEGVKCSDIFEFNFDRNGFVPSYDSLDKPSACTNWILQNGNADFMDATTTNGTTTCPNGTVLGWVAGTSSGSTTAISCK
jgi:prepilin-type N-terminal cleavage/methylation domain-containing protein